MKNLNSVAFVAQINEIKEIPGADNIEQAIVGGWSCIVKKGAHKVNELVICATTDAIIPQDLAEKLNITNYLRSGNRVRTVKLHGVYSECLIIPFKYADVSTKKSLEAGDDVMEALGIFKYEPPIKNIQLASGKKIRYSENPNFHVYYKFPNMKNVKGMFNEDDYVQITRKLHGTNARYGIVKKTKLTLWDKIKRFLRITDEWYEYEFVVGSHNVEKGSDSQGFYDSNVWYTIADKYKIKEKLWDFAKKFSIPSMLGPGFVIYGEIYGAGIQKNYDYGLKDIEFAVFDIMENGQYYSTKSTHQITNYVLELPHVKILYSGLWSQEIQDRYVLNNFIEGTKIPHEGVVVKYFTGERNKIAKVINPDYLIYGEKHDVGDSH
jgi:RNA ligase (TIGR02306 family)